MPTPMNKVNTSPTKIFSLRNAFLLSLGVGLLVAGLSVFFQAKTEIVLGGSRAEDSKSAAVTQTAVGFGSSFEVPGKPMRLIIPAIGVNAAIQSVGLSKTGNGTMGIPTNFTDVAWYNQGPRPGMPGSAVIDGHLDGRSVPRAVFYDLGSLRVGDLVEVIDEGNKTWQFRVISSKIYDYNATTSDIFISHHSEARLNLITCAGDWIKSQKLYSKRVVVFTELVKKN